MTTKKIETFLSATTLTISGGVISIIHNTHVIAAEAGTADDLDTINGGAFNRQLVLFPDAGDTITVKHGTGNIETGSGTDIVLSGNKVLHCVYNDASSVWRVIAVAASGAAASMDVTGNDAKVVTGTAGDEHRTARWDANGDLIEGSLHDNGTALYPDGSLDLGTAADPFGAVRCQSAYIGDTTIASNNIAINANGSGDRYAILDLVGDDTHADYGLRLIRGNGGANANSTVGHRGTGELRFTAYDNASITFLVASTTKATVTNDSVTVASGIDVLNAGGTPNIGTADDPFGTGYFTKLTTNAGDTGGTASTKADELVIEKTGDDGGLDIIVGSGNRANIFFGDSANPSQGRISYFNGDDSLSFYAGSQQVYEITSSTLEMASGKDITNAGGTPDIGSAGNPFGTGYFTELTLAGSDLTSLQGGTANTLQKADGSDGLSDSSITDDGSEVTVSADINLSSNDLSLSGKIHIDTMTLWDISPALIITSEVAGLCDLKFQSTSGFHGSIRTTSGTFYFRDAADNAMASLDDSGLDLASGSDINMSSGTVYAGAINFDDEDLETYDKGSWTPAEANVTLDTKTGAYVCTGEGCLISCDLTWPTTADANDAVISGLPFTTANNGDTSRAGLAVAWTDYGAGITVRVAANATTLQLFDLSGNALTNADLSEKTVQLGGTYETA